jgi:hypothetical protein
VDQLVLERSLQLPLREANNCDLIGLSVDDRKASGNDAFFFETEVAAATRSGTSDNGVINEVELQNPAGFVDPAR